MFLLFGGRHPKYDDLSNRGWLDYHESYQHYSDALREGKLRYSMYTWDWFQIVDWEIKLLRSTEKEADPRDRQYAPQLDPTRITSLWQCWQRGIVTMEQYKLLLPLPWDDILSILNENDWEENLELYIDIAEESRAANDYSNHRCK
jgi:hypothetical protein